MAGTDPQTPTLALFGAHRPSEILAALEAEMTDTSPLWCRLISSSQPGAAKLLDTSNTSLLLSSSGLRARARSLMQALCYLTVKDIDTAALLEVSPAVRQFASTRLPCSGEQS